MSYFPTEMNFAAPEVTPPRETLHEETLAMLAEDEALYRAQMPHSVFPEAREAMADQYAYAAQCVKEVADWRQRYAEAENARVVAEAENARLAAAAAIVEAMERGEIHVARGAGEWAIWHVKRGEKFRAPTLLAAYERATQGGVE